MSILRKKLDVKRGLPDHIKNNIAIWRPLHLAICTAFSALTQTPWEATRIELTFGELKALQSGLPDTGLCFGFGFGDADGECTLLAHYDSDFAARVTSRSLEMQEDATGVGYLPSILDLILFKPVAQIFETELGVLFTAIYKDTDDILRPAGQKLSPADFQLPKDSGVWNEVSFFIEQAEDKSAKAGENEAKAKAKKKPTAKVAPAPNTLVFKILLPQSLLQRLLASCVSDSAQLIDPENPWTSHMRRSVDTAVVPVRAVVETCRMTVADCTRFEIGQVIDLPGVSLQSIGLETEMSEDSVNIGSAALGIYKSHRAVKLIKDMDPEFCPSSLVI